MRAVGYTRTMHILTHRSFIARAFGAACLGIGLLLAACSQQAPQSTPAASTSAAASIAASNAAAQNELQAYRQTLAKHQVALAVPLGQDILQNHPGTAAAAEVQKTLPALAAEAKAQEAKLRLANLWYYQIANVQGEQSTATIYSTEPSGADRIQLVLRRHVKWGKSAYLFGPDGSKGFVCKGQCNLVMDIDGKRETWKAYLPTTGEPAMFIKDYKRFIATLEKSREIVMHVDSRAQGKQSVTFEVGGFDPTKFAPRPNK